MKKHIQKILSRLRPGRRTIVVASLGLVIGIFGIAIFLKTGKEAAAAWFDEKWLYRVAHIVGNSGSAIGEERKVKIEVDTEALIAAGKLQSDCDDARFTDAAGDPLEYFIDTDSGACDTSSTDFYVRLPQVIAGNQTIYFYYGNASASQGRSNDFFAPDTTGEGLKAYYKMDEASANTCSGGVNDTCDYALANDGAWNGDATYTASGKVGGGTTYDGSGDYVGVPDSGTTSSMTVTGWFKAGSTTTSGNFKGIFGNQGWATGFWHIQINGTQGGKLEFAYNGDSTTSIYSATVPSIDTWYHFAAVRTASGSRFLYLNGTSEATTTASAADNVLTSIRIGSTYDSSRFFNGSLDDVRIYSRALEASEITSIYNSGNGSSVNVPLTFTPTSSSAVAEEKSPGPVAYWSFDEGQGPVANDGAGGNNGTLTNGPVWRSESECISGKCLYFDGSDDYVSVNSQAIVTSDQVTVSAWIKHSGKANSTQDIIAKRTAVNNDQFEFYLDQTYKLKFDRYLPSGGSVTSVNSIPLNEWTYVSMVLKDSDNQVLFYINGKLDSTNSYTESYSGDSSSTITIGRSGVDSVDGTSDPFRNFHGFIDEVKIYPYARTAAQIKADYAARGSTQGVSAQIGDSGPVDQLSNGLVAYYPMDESAANSCTGGSNDTCDRSGNGNDGAWNGDAASAAGKYGNGVGFDGTGDYTLVNNNSAFNFTNEVFTISTWIKPSSLSTSYIIAKNVQTTGYGFYLNGANIFYVMGGNSVAQTPSGGITTSNWSHVVVTSDGSTGKIFVNGNQLASGNVGNITDTSGAINIGRDENGNFNYNGQLDETRIYNRALSPAEVRALYNWAPGPVAHWKLDDNAGTSAVDVSGNGNTGTLTGGPVWGQGKFGSAVSFDGGDDYIDGGNLSFFANLSTGSIGGWFKANTLPIAGSSFLGFSEGSNTQNVFLINVGDTGTVRVLLRPNSGTTLDMTTTGTPITIGNWHHIMYTTNTAGNALYVNGIKQSMTYTDGSASTQAFYNIPTSSTYHWIGSQRWSNEVKRPLNGSIDDVQIYNYALNTRQIANVMNGRGVNDAAVGSPVGHAVAHWSFDEGYGTTTQDKSIHGNDGTLTNMASPATATSGWSNSGKFGKALVFDGSNDYVEISDNSIHKPTSAISLSVWEKPTNTSQSNKGIITKRYADAADPYNSYFLGHTGTPSKHQFCISNGTSGTQTCIQDTEDIVTEWTHVIGTYDGGAMRLYKNGKLVASASKTGDIGYSTLPLYIGTSRAGQDRFTGLIDEVKIYNYALTEDDVRLEYNRGSSVVFGAKSTAADGITADNSSSREYCVPGDTSACSAPVAEWKLDENTGTTAQDTSGGGNTGTLTGGPTWTKGKFGRAVRFDGSDDFIDAGTAGNYTDNFTVSAWVKTTTANRRILARRTNSPAVTQYDFYTKATTGELALWNGSTIFNATTSVTDGNWHFATWVINGSSSLIYTDGKLEKTAFTAALSSISATTLIGAFNTTTSPQFTMDGLIDQVRIYNYARTPAQIAWEYNRGAPVAHYRFDECQGTTAYNTAPAASGDAPGNNGTITIGASGTNTSAGTCTGSAGQAWKDGATGKLGASLEFDGTDDYVSVTDNSILDVPNSITISQWVKLTGNNKYQFTVAKRSNTGSDNSYGIQIKNTNEARMRLSSTGSDDNIVTSNTQLTTGVWYHIVGVYDKAGSTMQMYINGKADGSAYTSFSSDLKNSAQPLVIGHSGSSNDFLDGLIDDVRIYNYALTPVQVRSLYNDGAVSFK